ncbi:hypothetical protein [Cereibacter johrii]|uniref:hypothetical protein n=1 Tax=Cereibacter johrii TaxID=445629 RepID=UPI0011BD7DBE|nr:hypothetical protein [Cereibacter johrii]
MEVVSRASLEFAAAMREMAEFVDGGLELKIGIQNTVEGSLRLNTLVKVVFPNRETEDGEEGVERRITVTHAAILGIMSWFFLDIGLGHYAEKMWEMIDDAVVAALWAEHQPEATKLDDEEAQRCIKAIEAARRNGVGEAHVRRFFSEIRTDPAVTGVGIALDHDQPPEAIIPREQFATLSRPVEVVEDAKKRPRIERATVLLVQPRLRGDAKQWRFSSAGGEFGAKIEDKRFVRDLLSGKIKIPMIEGVVMDVDIKIVEELDSGAWRVVSRTISAVHSIKEAPEQLSLLQPFDDGDDREDADGR